MTAAAWLWLLACGPEPSLPPVVPGPGVQAPEPVVLEALPTEGLVVTFIDIGEPAAFWDVVEDAMQASADDLDIHLEVLNAHGDRLRMLAYAEALTERDTLPDYVVITNDKGMGPRLLEATAGRGVPTLFMHNALEAEEEAAFGAPRERWPTYLGSLRTDNEAAGYDLARALFRAAEPLPPPWKMLAITGDAVTPAALERAAGLRRAIAEEPRAELQQLVHSQWREDKARRQLGGLLRRWPDTRLIWAANDPMAFGALGALRDAGHEPGSDSLVAGLNWSVEALQLVQDGTLSADVGGHFLIGAFALVLLRDHHDGIDFYDEGPHVPFRMGVLDASTSGLFLERFADKNWASVDFARFSKARNPEVQRYAFSLEPELHRER